MILTEEAINELKFIIDKNYHIFNRRYAFQKYCQEKLLIKIDIQNFVSYEDLLSSDYIKNSLDFQENIKKEKYYFLSYYEDISKEIENNKKVITIIKDEVIRCIKEKISQFPILSAEQIKDSNFDFLPEFYIEFFLKEFSKKGYLEKIEITDIKNSNRSKTIYKSINK